MSRRLLWLFVLSACGGENTTSTSADLPEGGRASITAEQIAALPDLSATQSLRIDGHEHVLSSIEWLGVDSIGTMAVLQPAEYGIRFFDATGRDLGSVGRKGRGPGEFERPIRAGWTAEQLWVQDPLVGRITFVSDMQVTGTMPSPAQLTPAGSSAPGENLYSAPYPEAVFSADMLLMRALRRSDEKTEILRATGDGVIIGSVVALDGLFVPAVTVRNGMGAMYVRPPFASRVLTSAAPDGRALAIVATDEKRLTWSLTVVGNEGDTLYTRDVGYFGEEIPRALMDSALESQLQRVPTPAQRMTARRELDPMLPSYFPPVTRVYLDNDHRAWIGFHSRNDEQRWLLIDATGRPEGIITLGDNGRVMAASGSAVYAVERDEMDVQSIVTYRVAQ